MYANKIGLTIEETAEYTGIGRDTLRRLIEWEKLPVLRIGRKSIIRTATIERFMELNQGVDLMEREQVRSIK
ncbi:helix-turn-helix domain-containing protein [Flintibacter sp.]|uniref:helix-turn-helix domain-containing protein n=1 Tax=Flintibacter sp. TaxID=1918624 RepID=UPI003D0C7316|nr:helix-turn-helix domain-containing protein [Flintibacter sp.]